MPDKIVIVGNGECALAKKNGTLIDSFNTVVRLGQYETEGYEDYVGSKTDIISTIYWKLNIERLKKHKVILSIPLNMQSEFSIGNNFINSEFNKHKKNIIYINEFSDIKGLMDMYESIMPPLNKENINFSLGFKTFYFIKKLFPKAKIYATGFDFFKTGWYWDPSHNRNDSNAHPYTFEKLWYLKMKNKGDINEL